MQNCDKRKKKKKGKEILLEGGKSVSIEWCEARKR